MRIWDWGIQIRNKLTINKFGDNIKIIRRNL